MSLEHLLILRLLEALVAAVEEDGAAPRLNRQHLDQQLGIGLMDACRLALDRQTLPEQVH